MALAGVTRSLLGVVGAVASVAARNVGALTTLRTLSTQKPRLFIKNEEETTNLLLNASKGKRVLNEFEGYKVFEALGISVPQWKIFDNKKDDPAEFARSLPMDGPWIAKGVVTHNGKLVTHKTEVRAIAFNVKRDGIAKCVDDFRKRFTGEYGLESIIFRHMVDIPSELGGEMFVSAYQDPTFGPSVCVGFGGTGVEYMKTIMKDNSSTIFIPVLYGMDTFEKEIFNLPIVRMNEGRVRGTKERLNHQAFMKTLRKLGDLISYYSPYNPNAPFIIEEIESNPAIAGTTPDTVGQLVALDAVISVAPPPEKPLSLVCKKPLHKIRHLFEPMDGVAIAGASEKNPNSPGIVIAKNMMEAGVPKDQIYILHPTAQQILGLQTVKDLEDLRKKRNGKPVSELVVAVPAKAAGQMVTEACTPGKYVAHSICVLSSGFAETEHGKVMEQELKAVLNKLNDVPDQRPVINGPNTLGNVWFSESLKTIFSSVFTPRSKASATFIKTPFTNCAVVCQSGAFMLTRQDDNAAITPEVACSIGNQMDLTACDFLEFLLNERKTVSTVAIYIEGLGESEGIRMMDLVRRARKENKFVVVYKAGRSKAGMEAAKGHTAAMAGDYGLIKTQLEHAGAVVVDSFTEFNDCMTTATLLRDSLHKAVKNVPKDKPVQIGAVSNAGFEKCAIADHLFPEADRVDVPHWSDETKKAIGKIFKKFGIGGIMDVADVLDLTPMLNDAAYEETMELVLNDKSVQAAVFSCVPMSSALKTLEQESKDQDSLLNRIIRLHKKFKDIKPFIVVIESGHLYDPFRKALADAGVPVFKSADAASAVLRKLVKAIHREDHQEVVPAGWRPGAEVPQFVKDVTHPYAQRRGSKMPVSAFPVDGACPPTTAAYEKRGIAETIPIWNSELCVQCNQCSYMCSHAAIRPFVFTAEEEARAKAEAGKNWASLKIRNAPKDKKDLRYRIQVSPYDCTGCGVCAGTCPENAITMSPLLDHVEEENKNWLFTSALPESRGLKGDVSERFTVRGSQFYKPLIEFSGACAGCPQPVYARILTQLFGESMMIANATGCSMIWSAFFPNNPYTTNSDGRGPAWGHSLFEDAAEFGYGMKAAVDKRRSMLRVHVEEALKKNKVSGELKEKLDLWLKSYDDRIKSMQCMDAIVPLLNRVSNDDADVKYMKEEHKMFMKPMQWLFGGDGWAYDIGYGGLDHVLQSGDDMRVLVFDNEVYSNTGGQVSKSTSRGAMAKFAASGKNGPKKDLASMLMSTGRMYVAAVSVGADKNQLLRAVKEASEYPGPSIVFAHNPCIAHGIKGGLNKVEQEMKEAVECGYWVNFRYDPRTGITLDSKPDFTKVRTYLKRNGRFASLESLFPKEAEEKHSGLVKDLETRYNRYQMFVKK